MRRVSLLFAFALCLAASACQSGGEPAPGTAPQPSGGVLLSDLSAALLARGERLRDFSYRGVLTREADGARVVFLFEGAQPGRVRVRLESPPVEFRFDGRFLVLVDESEHRILRRDLGTLDEATRLLALHQTFDVYSIEGWRAPMLRGDPARMQARAREDATGPHWILETPLDDDTLAFVRYEFRAPRGDFLKKEFITKAGTPLSSATVLEEWGDPRSGLRFPRAWEVQGSAGRYQVRLEDIQVNVGLSSDRWTAPAREGYTLSDLEASP